jgi:hypothetical protein
VMQVRAQRAGVKEWAFKGSGGKNNKEVK